MNVVFAVIIGIACVAGALTGSMEAVTQAVFKSAKVSVDISLGLIGYMAFFLGLFKIGEAGGLMRLLARAIRPVMVRLFPDVPADHPAMGAMLLNISANMLGLGNAATPFGIKAMHELNKLNKTPGVATNAMVLFLAINTSGLALLPSGVVSIRALKGSADPWGIMMTTLIATGISTVVAITAAKGFQSEDTSPAAVWGLAAFLLAGIGILLTPALGIAILGGDHAMAEDLRAFAKTTGDWVIPVLILSLILFGWSRGVKVYEVFVADAREGFDIAVRIIPFLVAILVAVGMFRASGAMDVMTSLVAPLVEPIGMPAEALPMALVRPLSGSGAFGLMTELLETHGPDSYIGYVASTLNGSTETTFYVLAVYFGSVGVSRVRHAVVAGLSADIAGALACAAICALMFGHLM